MSAQLSDILSSWLGTWRGSGKGSFPTIDDFDYEEELEFKILPNRNEVICIQNTFKRTKTGELEPSHLELGLLQIAADGQLEWINVQSGGRMEILRTELPSQPTDVLCFTSAAVTNDPKERPAVADERHFQIKGDSLTYRVRMNTPVTPQLTHHLEAHLKQS